jgi:superoxide dismutase, Fe-Mn family
LRIQTYKETNMRYQLAPLFVRPWTLNGITPRLIENHYELNYGDALRRLNAISAELEALDPATTPTETINRLKRDETAALNSTLMHEL